MKSTVGLQRLVSTKSYYTLLLYVTQWFNIAYWKVYAWLFLNSFSIYISLDYITIISYQEAQIIQLLKSGLPFSLINELCLIITKDQSVDPLTLIPWFSHLALSWCYILNWIKLWVATMVKQKYFSICWKEIRQNLLIYDCSQWNSLLGYKNSIKKVGVWWKYRRK